MRCIDGFEDGRPPCGLVGGGRALEIVEKHPGERGPLMPVLHELQDVFGYVDPRAVGVLAEALNLSRG